MYNFIFLHIAFSLSVADQWGTMRGNFKKYQTGSGTKWNQTSKSRLILPEVSEELKKPIQSLDLFVCSSSAKPNLSKTDLDQQKKSMPCVKFGSCTSDEWFLFGAGYTFLANDGWKLVHLLPSSWHLKLQMARTRLQEEHFSAFNRPSALSTQ